MQFENFKNLMSILIRNNICSEKGLERLCIGQPVSQENLETKDYWDLNIVTYFFFLQESQHDGKFHLKPTSKTEPLNTSEWPLLLKVDIVQIV